MILREFGLLNLESLANFISERKKNNFLCLWQEDKSNTTAISDLDKTTLYRVPLTYLSTFRIAIPTHSKHTIYKANLMNYIVNECQLLGTLVL